jgi:hypothetical protein
MNDLDRAVVDALERCAEGLIPAKEILASAGVPSTGLPFPFNTYHETPAQKVLREATAHLNAWVGATRARAYTVDAVRQEEGTAGRVVEWQRQSDIIRCIFGNPFRPVSFAELWRTDTVLMLARQMYDSRDFGAMPILADALQDAGCEDEQILNHCRDTDTTHVRGCWVVDLILGKE